MAGSNIPFDGYPAPGAEAIRINWKGWIRGNNNYQQGGYNLNATALGMPGGIEDAWPAYRTQSGNYFLAVFYPLAMNNANDVLPRAIPAPYVTLKWYAANGTEVANNTNLAAEVSLLAASGI